MQLLHGFRDSPNRTRDIRIAVNFLTGLALLSGLYWLSRLNYPLFHSFADMVVVFIAASVFVIIWNGRHLLDNQYYLFIGIAFLFFAFFDFLHLLGNKGMTIFTGYGNLGPTFYIISRYLLSISFVLAPLFVKRKIKTAWLFLAFLSITIVVLLSIFYWKNFPPMYLESTGLTSFKVISDYVIGFLFLLATGLLLQVRRSFDAKVMQYILFSLIFFIITGLSFTLYTDPFGLTNAIGHYLQIASFAMIYLAFVETGLAKPQNLLFRNLKQRNEEILILNQELEKVNNDLKYNVAELERTDAALKVSEAQANALIEYAPTAIFEIDLAGPRFLSINEAMCSMSGYSREELYAIGPKALLDEKSQSMLTERIRRLHAGEKQSNDEEYLVRKKDGSLMIAMLNISFPSSSHDTAFVIGHDITERKKHEDQLRESEERFRALSETSLIGVGVVSWDGVILYANHSYELLLGYSPDEMMGMPAANLYWNPEERTAWISRLTVGGVLKDVEILLKKKDGQPIWASISATPISFGGTQAILGSVQDIAERKKAEEELKRYSMALEVSNKELEAFAYSLSHDLRAPLRALDGFSQAILDDYDDKLDDEGRDYLNRIRGATQNMAQITEDMLKLSQVIRNELRWETINLSDMATDIAIGLREKEPARQVYFDIAQDISANGDPSLLRIALYNLFENAWKFSTRSTQPRIEFSALDHENERVFVVKDNGIGFDMRYQDKLFQPFQRLHAMNDFPGHGIGLATVQRVINRHGGRIWVDSEPGKGTNIYFTLGSFAIGNSGSPL